MMSMLNQAAVEALCSATYLENYLDCMENLPDDLQRVVSQLRELDRETNDVMQEITHHQEIYLREGDGAKKQRSLLQIQRGLIKSQEIGDEKLSLVSVMVEHIENRTRQLEQDLENLDPGAEKEKPEKVRVDHKSPKMLPAPTPITISNPTPVTVTPQAVTPVTSSTTVTQIPKSTSKPSPVVGTSAMSSSMEVKVETPAGNKMKRQRRQRMANEPQVKEEEKKEEEDKQPAAKKKKKRKGGKKGGGDKDFAKTLVGEPIDPDEPTYCLCEQVSYGDMIGCDNDGCVIEWFHFNCVQLSSKPKGKWYCPKCRGDKPNIKRQDLK